MIITEGEYDCMAVSDALSALPESDPLRQVPAISLPNGCNSLPVELIPLLDSFKKIYLWMDNDKSVLLIDIIIAFVTGLSVTGLRNVMHRGKTVVRSLRAN